MMQLTQIKINTVANGSYNYPLNATEPLPVNVVEYITFTPAATAGTVTIQLSPDNGNTWDDMAVNGTVNAADTSSTSRLKPSGRGLATHARITLSGVAGATGVTIMISQGDK